MMTFSEKLVVLRKIKHLTQDEFASAVGVSRQAVYKWESGQSYPEALKLVEIKLLFGISIDDLLDDNYDIPLPEKKKRKRTEKKEERKVVTIPAMGEKKVELLQEEAEKSEKMPMRTEIQKAAEIDVEKLMQQITKKLWEEREGCGRRLR